MSYKSPINIYMGEHNPINTAAQKAAHDIIAKEEEYIYKYIADIGVRVDKEELLRALNYDRDQYHRGYRDGYDDARDKYERLWIPITERLPESDGYYLVTINTGHYNSETREIEAQGTVCIRYYFSADDVKKAIFCQNCTAWMPLPEPSEIGIAGWKEFSDSGNTTEEGEKQ